MEIPPISHHDPIKPIPRETPVSPFSIKPETDLPATPDFAKAKKAQRELGLVPVQIDALRRLPADQQPKLSALIIANAIEGANRPNQ